MSAISVHKLVDDNTEALNLKWEIKYEEDDRSIDSKTVNSSTNGLIGHLNLIHPNWIQILVEQRQHTLKIFLLILKTTHSKK